MRLHLIEGALVATLMIYALIGTLSSPIPSMLMLPSSIE